MLWDGGDVVLHGLPFSQMPCPRRSKGCHPLLDELIGTTPRFIGKLGQILPLCQCVHTPSHTPPVSVHPLLWWNSCAPHATHGHFQIEGLFRLFLLVHFHSLVPS